MSITWIGLVLIALATMLLVRAQLSALFALLLATLLLGGSAAITLPALGGSSIPPSYVALGFLGLRVMLEGRRRAPEINAAVERNLIFAFYTLVSVLTALLLPRLFSGQLQVVPMRPPASGRLFDTEALRFTNQNITTAVYMLGSLLAAVAASLIAAARDGERTIYRAFVGLTWAHVGAAVLALVLTSAGRPDLVQLVRNGSYAQLSGEVYGFVRITGFFPEASTFAAFGFPLLIFCTEAWLRRIRPRTSGAAALVLGLTLALSTSSTSYVCLAGYLAVLVLRWFAFPSSFGPANSLKLIGLGLAGLVLVLGGAVFFPTVFDNFGDMLKRMTIDKAQSSSGVERKFWAQQGLNLFQHTWGLGVGAGSFRSSSLVTAVMGSTGLIGLAAIGGYLLRVFKPLDPRTYLPSGLARPEVGACCAWAATLGLLPAAISGSSPDLGLEFALFAGCAVTLRSRAAASAAEVRPAPMASSPT